MSIKILNEGFELLHKNSLCEEKSNSSDLEKALEDALNHLAMKQEMNIKKYEIAFQDVIESRHPDKSWWEVTDCNIFWDLMENRDPSLTIKHIIDKLKPEFKESLEEGIEDKFFTKAKADAKKLKSLYKKVKDVDKAFKSLGYSYNGDSYEKKVSDGIFVVFSETSSGRFDYNVVNEKERTGTASDVVVLFKEEDEIEEAFNEFISDKDIESIRTGNPFRKGKVKIEYSDYVDANTNEPVGGLFTLYTPAGRYGKDRTVFKDEKSLKDYVNRHYFNEDKRLKETVKLKESFPTHGNKIDLEKVIQALWEKGNEISGEDWIEVFNPNEVSKLQSGEEYCNRIEVTGADDKQIKISLKTNGRNIEYQIFNEGRDWKKASSIDELWKVIFDRVGRKTNESLRRKPMRESEKEPEIKRYSDVRPRSERKYWYFTTHGVQPGSIPRDLNVLEIRDGQNDIGTWGTYVMLDGVLNTSELKKYDMRELVPPMHESKKRRIHERNLTRSERHNRDMEKIFSTKKAQDKKFADFLRKNGYSEEQVDKLQKQDKLSAEIASKFTPKGKQPSDVLGKILKEAFEKKSKERFYASSYDEDRNLTDIETNDVDEVLEFVFERFDESSYFEVEDRVAGKSFTVDVEKYKDSYEAYKKLKKLLVESLKRKSKKSTKESFAKKHAKKLKESHRRKLTESFDDMEVFMNTWANYNEYGADGVLTPTGWMSIDEAIDYCEEYADYEPFINDTDNVPFDDINEYSNASSALQELKELQESGVYEDVLEAIIEATGYSVKEAIEIAESGDYYFYPGLSDYTDLAYAIVDELGGIGEAVGKNVINYIDEDQMRREYRWDIREIMRDTAEQEVDDAHDGEVDISNVPTSKEFSIDEWFDEDDEYTEDDLREQISDALEYEYDSAPVSFDIEVSNDGKKVTAKNIEWDGYDREQEIEDWMDEHEDEWLDMIIGEEIEAAERGEADLSSYFDYEAFGRDLSFDGYTITDKGIILVM